jgi:membrane associated rhomboid family serine protease
MERKGPFWVLHVPVTYRRAAVTAISLYFKENIDGSVPAVVPASQPQWTYSALPVLALLVAVHWAVRPGYERDVFISSYGADSAAILGGDLYRCVTALLFHKDWSHLLANLFGLALFGSATAAICRWGVGWLLILAAGSLGNYLNALWYGGNHISIGASTAVFAAVGICAVLTFGVRMRSRQHSWRAWIPLGGGIALLAMMGASPQSDVLAHFFGFVAGLVLGGLYTWRFVRPLGRGFQFAAALLGFAVLAFCWMAGVSH